MKHTPLDLEKAMGKLSFLEASLLPASDRTQSARPIARAGRDYPLDAK